MTGLHRKEYSRLGKEFRKECKIKIAICKIATCLRRRTETEIIFPQCKGTISLNKGIILKTIPLCKEIIRNKIISRCRIETEITGPILITGIMCLIKDNKM